MPEINHDELAKLPVPDFNKKEVEEISKEEFDELTYIPEEPVEE